MTNRPEHEGPVFNPVVPHRIYIGAFPSRPGNSALYWGVFAVPVATSAPPYRLGPGLLLVPIRGLFDEVAVRAAYRAFRDGELEESTCVCELLAKPAKERADWAIPPPVLDAEDAGRNAQKVVDDLLATATDSPPVIPPEVLRRVRAVHPWVALALPPHLLPDWTYHGLDSADAACLIARNEVKVGSVWPHGKGGTPKLDHPADDVGLFMALRAAVQDRGRAADFVFCLQARCLERNHTDRRWQVAEQDPEHLYKAANQERRRHRDRAVAPVLVFDPEDIESATMPPDEWMSKRGVRSATDAGLVRWLAQERTSLLLYAIAGRSAEEWFMPIAGGGGIEALRSMRTLPFVKATARIAPDSPHYARARDLAPGTPDGEPVVLEASRFGAWTHDGERVHYDGLPFERNLWIRLAENEPPALARRPGAD